MNSTTPFRPLGIVLRLTAALVTYTNGRPISIPNSPFSPVPGKTMSVGEISSPTPSIFTEPQWRTSAWLWPSLLTLPSRTYASSSIRFGVRALTIAVLLRILSVSMVAIFVPLGTSSITFAAVRSSSTTAAALSPTFWASSKPTKILLSPIRTRLTLMQTWTCSANTSNLSLSLSSVLLVAS